MLKSNMVMPAGLEASELGQRGARLADPGLRRDVEIAVKRRIRGDEAEDVVQAALADVLSAARVPDDAEEFRRFVFAVTRNKVFDHFRRRQREVPEDHAHEPEAAEPPLSARDILRWAEQKLPDAEARDTLHWMLREGDGEKLEHIARDANLPAPRVRQRVSRLRRFLRERWAAELMLGTVGLALLMSAAAMYYRHLHPKQLAHREPVIRPEPLHVPELARSAAPANSAPEQSAMPAPTTSPSAVPTVTPRLVPRGKSMPTSLPKTPAPSSIDWGSSEPTPAPRPGK